MGAALECERVIFLSQSQAERVDALLLKTNILKLGNDFERAYSTVARIPMFGLTDSVRFEVLYQRMLCSYLTERFAEADAYATQIAQNPLYLVEGNHERVILFRVLILNEMQKWDEAAQLLYGLAESVPHNDTMREEYNDLLKHYAKGQVPRLRSEKTLFWVSLFPGAGIVYAGKPLEGVLSFLINSTILALGVHQFYHGYYITGYIGGATLLEKFYTGGRKRSEYLLRKRNFALTNEFNSRVKGSVIRVLSL